MLRLLPLLAACLLAGCAAVPFHHGQLPEGARADVAVLETTDVHANVLGYDYFKAQPDPTLGFDRTATLIRQAREEFENSLLFDDGDTIQGTVLADYQAMVRPLGCDQELAIYRAMDVLGYDGGTIGNHEFNYGLPYLAQVTGTPMPAAGSARRCAGPHFPQVLANVYDARDGQPIYAPWKIIDRTITAYTPDGSPLKVPLKVAIIGFAPPPIMQWDRAHLAGRVTVSGVVEAARRYLPQIRAQHPDLVVAMLHGGLDRDPYSASMENGGWYLAGVPGIDVLLLGHSHSEFPGPRYAGMPQVDAARGFVRGVPTVMGGFFGRDLGVVRLALLRKDGRWTVDREDTHSEVRPICPQKDHCVPADPAIRPLVAKAHAAAVAYVNQPIGRSEVELSSYFADEGNSTALAVVNQAQRDYVLTELPKLHPELADLPVLSAAAAFRTGFGGPADYTDVRPGPLTLRSAADLYFYPNTLSAVRVDGAGLKAWLERSAQRFARIDPTTTAPQPLIDPHSVGYNFDQLQAPGLAYVIDPTRPVGQRITALTWQGRPVSPQQVFVVATNNYRANGGGNFPGLDGHNLVLDTTDAVRDVVAAWLKRHGDLRARDLAPRAWRFAPVHTRGPVVFTGASGKLDVARRAGLAGLSLRQDHGDGTATYAIDLSAQR